jgi:hypothetical protein
MKAKTRRTLEMDRGRWISARPIRMRAPATPAAGRSRLPAAVCV